jgi:hypothetical protein
VETVHVLVKEKFLWLYMVDGSEIHVLSEITLDTHPHNTARGAKARDGS